jgi:hypothetical protein
MWHHIDDATGGVDTHNCGDVTPSQAHNEEHLDEPVAYEEQGDFEPGEGESRCTMCSMAHQAAYLLWEGMRCQAWVRTKQSSILSRGATLVCTHVDGAV